VEIIKMENTEMTEDKLYEISEDERMELNFEMDREAKYN
jgi:hypothetical protein